MAERHPIAARAGRAGWPALCVLIALAATPAGAKPLDKETCKALLAKEASLVAAGAKADLEKGPSAGLDAERVARVRSYILVEEQLLFRCGLAAKRYREAMKEKRAAARRAATAAKAAAGGRGGASPKPIRAGAAAVARTSRARAKVRKRSARRASAGREAVANPFRAPDD